MNRQPMSIFSSDRERRLWFWAVAAVAAIYASLGQAGVLADVLRESGLLEISFAAGLLVAVAVIVAIGLTRRPGRLEIWVALGIAGVYGMVLVRLGVGPVERTHLFEYGLVAVLIHLALVERRRNGRQVPAPAILAILTASLLGLLDEAIQWLLPNRVFDPVDMLFNTLAALMAVVASLALAWARRRVSRQREAR